MEKLSKYKIHISALGDGIHPFEYDLGQEFFEAFEHPVVQGARVHVNLNLDRKENMLVLDFTFKGALHVECHRCLEEFEMPLDLRKALIVKLTGTAEDVDDDQIILAENAHELNIAQHMYDFISLSLPIKVVHPLNAKGKSTCNPKAIKQIEKFMLKEELHNDPRWEALKNINPN